MYCLEMYHIFSTYVAVCLYVNTKTESCVIKKNKNVKNKTELKS